MANNILIRDEALERLFLGTALNYPDEFLPVMGNISKDCFYSDRHQNIYQAISNIAKKGDNIDMISVSAELRKIGSEVTRFDLVNEIMPNKTFGHLEEYSYMLRDYARQRACFSVGSRLVDLSQTDIDDVDGHISQEVDNLTLILNDGNDNTSCIDDALQALIERVNANFASQCHTGTKTGFEQFDNMGGLQGSDLIIIAAETSQGKTSLAIKFSMESIKSGDGVCFYSMEMTKTQLVARMAAMESKVSSKDLLLKKLTDEELFRFDKAVGSLSHLSLYFDDRSTSNIDNIICSIRRMKAKNNIKGAVVDYLQILLVGTKGRNEEQQLGEAARKLKNLAKELDIWIVALSQLNRDSVNPVPSLSRLRSSGQIAEAADIVILIYRPEYYGNKYSTPFSDIETHNTALIDIAKGRNIGLCKFICGFTPETTNFYPIEPNLLPQRSAIISHNDDNPF